MLWFLLPLIYFIYGVYRCITQNQRSYYDEPWTFFPVCIVTFMILGVSIISGAVVGSSWDTHRVNSGRTELAALRDKDGMAGRFFLGSGMIESKPYFFYWRKNKDGSLSATQIESSGVKVFEDTKDEAYIQYFRFEIIDADSLYWLGFKSSGTGREFHVPEGTIRRGFSL